MSLALKEPRKQDQAVDQSDTTAQTSAGHSSRAATRRVNVNFSEATYQALEELAHRRGKSMAEALRDAVMLNRWLDEALEEGGRLYVKQNGETRELVLL
jgi:hypothetical protein